MIGYVLIGAVVLMMMLVIALMRLAGRSEIDYFDLSAMGIVWLVFGAVMLALGDENMLFFLIIGIASAAAGLSHAQKCRQTFLAS
jgi:type III secretory pathway component EscU